MENESFLFYARFDGKDLKISKHAIIKDAGTKYQIQFEKHPIFLRKCKVGFTKNEALSKLMDIMVSEELRINAEKSRIKNKMKLIKKEFA